MKKFILASAAILALVAASPKNHLAQRRAKKNAVEETVLAQTKALAQSQAQCGPLVGDPSGCYRDECDRVNYDHTCNYLRDNDCLLNSIDILGGKIILVNLDDRCAVEQYEREGIFLEVGDLVLFAGRSNYDGADQEWDHCDCDPTDYDILYEQDHSGFYLESAVFEGYYIDYIWYEGIAAGQTRVDLCFTWYDAEVIRRSFDVYVGMRPTLAVSPPRHSCHWCGDDDNHY